MVLDELIGPALMTLRDLLDEPATPPAVRLATARDVLDRTGHKQPKHWDEVPPPFEVIEGWIDQLIAEAEEREARQTSLN